MQEKLHELAVRLTWLQPLAAIVGVSAFFVAGYVALDPGMELERKLVPTFLLSCWCLLVFTLVSLFRAIPPAIDNNQGFFLRQKIRLQHFLRNILALLFLILTVALLVLSYRLLVVGVG
ncbi:MAG: hypothetical protein R3F50_06585 [Gammaproteobacteria bacterium]|jgi:hypothetical protein